MTVTVLWEDARGGELKGFGPHELLLACIADELESGDWWARKRVAQRSVEAHPKKGNANGVKALKGVARDLFAGPVVAVLDVDRAHELWSEKLPRNCKTAIGARIRKDAPGGYEIVFLIENVESLLHAASAALGEPALTKKPTPDDRDVRLGKVAGDPTKADARNRVRSDLPSFDRLVKKVTALVRET